MSRDNYLERIAERIKEVREKPIDGDPERKHKWYMKNRDRILAQCKENYKRRKTMSRDKQIEEMARDLCECYNCDGTCYQDDKPCDLRCDEYTNAQYLYEKGYRKASEVAREIFEEIEDALDRCAKDNGAMIIWAIAELKKKYTEEGK